MCIMVHGLTYMHPDKEVLFRDISFSLMQGKKAALIGDNGCGKSTLLRLISRNLELSAGEIICSSTPYYIPQHFGQYNNLSVAAALKIEDKLEALHSILEGDASPGNFDVLADDWQIEERALSALSFWDLGHIQLSQALESLSGGEKTKVFLAGIYLHNPGLILMDEPTNHLDIQAREKFYRMVSETNKTILVVSHDRILLNMIPCMLELSAKGIMCYGGNYDFYKGQKELELTSLETRLEEKEKELRAARKTAREVTGRRQKLDARGEERSRKKGISRMGMNTLKDKAEKSTSKLKDTHEVKIKEISENLSGIRKSMASIKNVKLDFTTSSLHTGKILVKAEKVNFTYGKDFLWQQPLSFEIRSGDRIAIKGNNGSGKTTLLKLVTGKLFPQSGVMSKNDFTHVFLDQEYSIIDDGISVLEQVVKYNSGFREHEVKTILNRFLFHADTWDKPCVQLSGGEKMKLALCCLMVNANAPDMFILDEPANNIDIRNMEILASTIREYKGTVVIISHDEYFLSQVGINKTIHLSS